VRISSGRLSVAHAAEAQTGHLEARRPKSHVQASSLLPVLRRRFSEIRSAMEGVNNLRDKPAEH
jgi:hypothetical protein